MKSYRIISFLFVRSIPVFLVLVVMVSACGFNGESQRPVVAATIFPVADWCRNLLPEDVEVICLVPPSIDPHIFEPGVQQAKDIHRTQMVVCIGSGFDYWIEPIVRQAAGKHTRLVFLSDMEEENFEAEDHDGHDHHSESNPHFWLDPIWAQEAVVRIADTLKESFPSFSDRIETKSQQYRSQLSELHFEIAEAVQSFPHKQYAGDHGAFYHFAKRYGLEEVASIEPWAGKEPSMRDARIIIEKLRTLQKPVIFIEPHSNHKAADIIAAEVPCPVLILDPMGNPDIPGRDTYLNFMRFNLQSLKKGLGN